MRLRSGVSATFAGLALLLFPGSHAEGASITYAFTATATSGPLNGTVANGTFSYDSGSVIPGDTNSDPTLLTDLVFTWDSIVYDATTANTGFLMFDLSGELVKATFGNNCSPGTCIVTTGLENWWIGGTNFDYSVNGNPTAFAGTVTMTQMPEPSTVTMFLAGLGILIGGLWMPARRTAIPARIPKSCA